VTKPTDPSQEQSRSARAAIWVGAGIFLSRIAGLVREVVFGYYFGATAVADVWRTALRTSYVIQNLLGEGTLSASFIPVYAEFLEKGKDQEAGRFAGAALGILTVVSFGLALLGMLLAPAFIPWLYSEWEPWMQDLAVTLVRIVFPMTAILVLSAWALGILNSHRKFFVSYVAPVVWNLALVAAMVGAGTYLGWWALGRNEDMAVALAWGALAGGVLQLLVQIPWVLPLLSHIRLSLVTRVEGVREAIRNFVPVVAARGVVNLSSLIDFWLAHFLVAGAAALMGFAQTLYLLPISLFGMAIAASELPELSRRRDELASVLVPRVRAALERLGFLLIPSVLAYLTLGEVFVAGLFQRGAFDPDATTVAYLILSAYALGLYASGSSRALSSAFYALRDTRTPALIASGRVVLSVGVGAALMFPFDTVRVGALGLGAVGLALGSAVGAWFEYGLLRRRLAKVLGAHGPRGGKLPRYLISGMVASGAGFGAKVILGFSKSPGVLTGWLGSDSALVDPLSLMGTATVFGVAYLMTTSLLGVGMPLKQIARPGR